MGSYMDAKETRKDWTEAKGTREFDIYHTDPGKVIETIVSPTFGSFQYIDTNTNPDQFGGNGCVNTFTFVGDSHGDDAGINTNVTITFNPIRLQLKEKGNCISTQTLHQLNSQRALSPILFQHIKALERNSIRPMKILNN